MAIFLPEENQALKGKDFQIPKHLKKHLGQYFAIKKQYSDEPGYKKLQHLLNPQYNDRSQGKKTQGMRGVPYGSLKRLKNAFEYSAPNSLEYNLMGGEEMRHWVNDTLNRERTKVKPTLPQKNNNATKPSKPNHKDKSLKSGNLHINIQEAADSSHGLFQISKTIIITEKQLHTLKQLLVEGRNADKARAKTLDVIRRYFRNSSWLDNEFMDEAANPNHLSVIDYVENKLKDLCFHGNIPDSIIRLEPIIMNIALNLGFEQDLADTQKLNRLYKFVDFIKRNHQKGTLPIQLNTLTLENTTYDTLNDIFGRLIDAENAAENDRIENADYSKGINPDYKIISNVDYETAHKYGEYSCSKGKLCYTQSQDTWDRFTGNGENSVYILLTKNWQDVPEKHGKDTPYDEYGLSMIFLFVDKYGDLVYSNTRWNHETNGNGPRDVDQSFTKERISQLLNANFNQIFLPSHDWDDLVKRSLELIDQGVPFEEIFGSYRPCKNGMVWVGLENKCNFYNPNTENFISDEWFDWASSVFSLGFAPVEKNGMYNLVSENGKVISPDLWFDSVRNFDELTSLCRVSLNGKQNFITTEGKLLYDPWVDFIGLFNSQGYAKIISNDKRNIIDTHGKTMSSIWFDSIDLFLSDIIVRKDGMPFMFYPKTSLGLDVSGIMVRRGLECSLVRDFQNQKANFYCGTTYDGENNYLFPNTWFDYAIPFEKYNSQLYEDIKVEIAKLEQQLDNVRSNREYDFLTSEIKKLETTAAKVCFRAEVVLDKKRYFVDLYGNLFSESNSSKQVGSIQINKDVDSIIENAVA